MIRDSLDLFPDLIGDHTEGLFDYSILGQDLG